MRDRITFDIIVIGAGPSGIALGHILKEKNLKYLILEKGRIANSFFNMPDKLSLITLWRSNYLREEDRELFDLNSTQTAKEYGGYLVKIAQDLEIEESCEVLGIAKEDIYTLKTSSGDYQSKIVVDASGYFSSPYIPKFQKNDVTAKIYHFNDFKNADMIHSDDRILIVGSRLSAGQLIGELSSRCKNISLSLRSEVKYSSKVGVRNFFLRNIKLFDFLISLFGRRKKLEVPMDYEYKQIVSTLSHYPKIASITHKSVTFEDSRVAEFDYIFFATGYENVGQFTKHYSTKNFYSIGRECLYSFKSRFLRGIREDVFKLWKEIEVNI
ncbi:NAD(P)-binding domain-containing protein [Halobacteriovorax marinus]|uniref:NAD(P)-binding domain-containing protein n=1 Tax=Halobacteriovorax marinus TaxID=97084 RepID=UPI003A958A64